jgi:tyrosyl-tRNA synthetase
LTDHGVSEIEELTDASKVHPKAAKLTLAHDIVSFYHGAQAALVALGNWETQYSQRKDPDNIPEVVLPAGETGLLQLLVKVGFCKSNNEARQKVTEGAVSIGPDRTKATDPRANVTIEDGLIVRLGSKKITRIRLGGAV